jgi:hypothetical protein
MTIMPTLPGVTDHAAWTAGWQAAVEQARHQIATRADPFVPGDRSAPPELPSSSADSWCGGYLSGNACIREVLRPPQSSRCTHVAARDSISRHGVSVAVAALDALLGGVALAVVREGIFGDELDDDVLR